MIYFKKKYYFLLIILLLLNSCISLPGINKSPNKKNLKKNLEIGEYSIEDVAVNLIQINQLSDDQLNNYNKNKNLRSSNKVSEFKNIYHYNLSAHGCLTQKLLKN